MPPADMGLIVQNVRIILHQCLILSYFRAQRIKSESTCLGMCIPMGPQQICNTVMIWTIMGYGCARKGKVRKGMEKEWERMLFFLSYSSIFGTLFLPVFGQNHEKRVKKETEWQKNGWKDVERDCGAILPLSKFLNLENFYFLYHLKPIFDPFKSRSWPRSNAVLAPFQTYSCPFLFPFLVFLALLTCHIQIRATSNPIIGPCRTITGLQD